MAVVYKAEQTEPDVTKDAYKNNNLGIHTRQQLARY